MRDPRPPAIGPETFEQYQIMKEDGNAKKIESFIDEVMNFVESKAGEDIDTVIFKIEALQKIFEPKFLENRDKSVFEDLLRQAKAVKESSEKSVEHDDDYTDYEFDDSLPDYYWGGEDGNEIIFREDEEKLD